MSISEGYSGQDALISYITKNKIISYCRFLKSHRNIIVTSIISSSSTFSDNWNNLDNLWAGRFLCEGKNFPDLKDKIATERLRYAKTLQIFWNGIIKEYKKEKKNLVTALASHSENVIETPTNDHSISVKDDYCKTTKKNASHSENVIETPTNDHSISVKDDYYKITKKNINIIDFCCDILQELDGKSNIHPFYKYDEKETAIKNPMDLFTINSKLENNQYTSIKEFEKDIRLIFRNCYTYNNIESDIYYLGEELESVFNKIWTKKIISYAEQKEKLKRVRDISDANLSSEPVTKQIRILEQNKDKLVYNQVVNNAFLIASAYESLVAGNLLPFIEILKTFLSARSKMSLSSANEPVLQAIVESLLPLEYSIPELSLVMDGTKLKGFGRFGYSDIFVLKGIGDNYVSLELKYISLVNLIKNQKDKFNTNVLEKLDKIIEKEDEKVLLERSYTYWSKEYNETKQTTIGEILDSGVNQLKSYMNIISKGKTSDYFSSGIFDKRIKIIKSNPNKLSGFVILVIGFHRILWRSVEEKVSNYSYNKV
ncbi:unnamed protein product [Rhizophagus irregularis]|uniref:Bromo domain-containing protein n=1 Tax=Rhizophagus irregularis TaxID=588596 RepID=A0A915ZC33_9GLOM|nr:unnamed protein product [Rhizophagus irregularis]CAB5115196.1 unnamed protein product [Rhizophagus irregularis]CAB5369182.1 unnamed protein product [Rhizophagus irregularis]